jgi:Protein of unknown function (DUF1634)
MRDVDISRLENLLGRLLLGGVLSSAVCLAAGLTVSLIHASPSATNLLLTTGLMILMATPVLRVVVSLVEYFRMRDWFFVATTLMVLIVLFVTLSVAFYSAKRPSLLGGDTIPETLGAGRDASAGNGRLDLLQTVVGGDAHLVEKLRDSLSLSDHRCQIALQVGIGVAALE